MTAHRHDFAVPQDVERPSRCRLCTANDTDAVIEHLASELWESRRHGTLDDREWEAAESYWQGVFREFAQTAVKVLRVA